MGVKRKSTGAKLSARTGKPVTSRHLGVWWDKNALKWGAQVRHGGRMYRLGSRSDEREAAIAHDRAALYFKSDAPLNVPRESKRRGPASPNELRRLARLRNKLESCLSRYFGVTWCTQNERWMAFHYLDHRRHRRRVIAYFDCEQDAAVAHDRVVLHLFGSDVQLNFPERRLSPAPVSKFRRQQRQKRKASASSRYFGVGFQGGPAHRNRAWQAAITVNTDVHFLGLYETEKEAAIAHDRAARHYHGDAAILNFPKEPTAPADATTIVEELRRAFKKETTSRFRGVSWEATRRKWRAGIYDNGKSHFLGLFSSEEEAAAAYDRRALAVRGDRARLNFDPLNGKELCGNSRPPGSVRRATTRQRDS